MFQKLYRHLEDIGNAVKQQGERSALSQQWGAKISGQLEDIQETFRQKPKRGPWRFPAIIGGVLTALLVSVVVLLFLSIKDLRNDTHVALDRSAENGQASLVLFTQVKASHERTRDLETEVARLDSLVQLQSQTIFELKKLNETTVQNFLHIRRDLHEMKKDDER